ncbi:TlpA family protein disulfide reductase [Dyadobacter pollutisoli]|uniref:TlpA disulfide reductase family protein n=1 Tax=Dyadobacter pollutisoli TaxID=2910158 RepID=A0A9E8SLN1_9BACT|nr:TlpA disulfide reductase family protein [Dyadobacter pollutisoli]WAC13263.1 TlpA disulfide reductase family protein [Dyadobacter pollutisoli]
MNSRFCSPGNSLPYIFNLLLVYFLLWGSHPLKAQKISQIRPLAIGDTVPDVAINRILHYQTASAKRSDFKGKLLILDFWATWCSPCVSMIPKMDSLQNQFEGKVQFLPVTTQPENTVTAFRAKYEKRHGKRILHPEVVSDSILGKFFYHNSLPHYVWIDRDGVVVAVTGMDQINSDKISSYLRRAKPVLNEKRDEKRIAYDQSRPLLANGNGGDGSNMIYHSVLTRYTPGMQGRFSWNIDPKTGRKITVTNCSRFWLYRIAYAKPGNILDEGSVVIESERASRLTTGLHGQHYLDWLKDDNGFCYELIVPAGFQDKTNAIMQQDLINFFPDYAAAMENRTRKCLALVRMEGQGHLLKPSAGGRAQISIDPFEWKLANASLGSLVDRFNLTQNCPLNLVDQTGHTAAVDLQIEGNISNLPDLNKALARYGLMLTEKQLDRPVLVIRDREPTSK